MVLGFRHPFGIHTGFRAWAALTKNCFVGLERRRRVEHCSGIGIVFGSFCASGSCRIVSCCSPVWVVFGFASYWLRRLFTNVIGTSFACFVEC